MRIFFRIAVLFVLVLSVSCARSARVETPRPEGFIAFHSFIFIRTKKENYRVSGDTAIVPGRFFKMRITDNLINRHLFDFISSSDGANRIVFPSSRVVYRRNDEAFSRIMTHYVHALFGTNESLLSETNKMSEVLLENNRIKYIMIPYYDREIKIEILMRFPDGKPRRLRIQRDDDQILFDVVTFTDLDFSVKDKGFAVIEKPGSTFFDWIGELNAKK